MMLSSNNTNVIMMGQNLAMILKHDTDLQTHIAKVVFTYKYGQSILTITPTNMTYSGQLWEIAKMLYSSIEVVCAHGTVTKNDNDYNVLFYDVFKIDFSKKPYQLLWLGPDKPSFFDELSKMYSKFGRLEAFS